MTTRICLAAALLLFGVGQLDAAYYLNLGDLPGGPNSSRACDVSADGAVVVGYGSSAQGNEAFRWTAGGGMVGLGDLTGGHYDSKAFGVSADGSVVVGVSRSESGDEAFRWTAEGGMVGLGFLSDGNFSSEALAVSADGSVVVGCSSTAAGTEAFRWTAQGGMAGLGYLPGGSSSRAFGVSADGSVIVGSGSVGSSTEAFIWTAGGGMVALGDLPGGDHESEALDVSADGSVVIGEVRRSATFASEPFRWTAAGGMVGLGQAPTRSGQYRYMANGVSADGSILVGTSVPTGQGAVAFVWDAAHGTRLFSDMLIDDFGINMSAWDHAEAVSDDGDTVVGYRWARFREERPLVAYLGNEIHWSAGLDGQWDDSANWNAARPPTSSEAVFIQPDQGLVVTGPAAPTTVKSLEVGTTGPGIAELQVQTSGELLVEGDLTVETNGKLRVDGGVEATGEFSNRGEIELLDGSRIVGQTIVNSGAVAVGSGAAEVFGDVIHTGNVTVSGTGSVTFFDDVYSDGTIQVSANSSAEFHGLLTGSGGVDGDGTVLVEGDLKPGNSLASISFGGHLAFGPDAAVEIEIGGTAMDALDRITVVQTVDLAGRLHVVLFDGFSPAAGDSFEFLTADSAHGQFANASPGVSTLTTLFGTFDVAYSDTSVILSGFIADPLAPAASIGSQSDHAGSALGGSGETGGLDADFHSGEAGTLVAQYQAIPTDDLAGLIDSGLLSFDEPDFALPGDEMQVWDIEFDGDAIGPAGVTIVFGYDDTGLAIEQELNLDVYHFQDADWVALGGIVDVDANTVTATVLSLSPFAIGTAIVPEPSTVVTAIIGLLCLLAAARMKRRVG